MDSFRPIITGLLGALIAHCLIYWVRSASADAGDGILRYGWRSRVVALLILATALFIGYAAIHASASQRFLAYLIGGGSVAFAVWLLLEMLFTGARVTRSHLEVWSLWRGRRRIPWSAVTSYEYSSAMGWHVLDTSGYGTVRLSVLLSGVDQIGEHLEHRLGNDS